MEVLRTCCQPVASTGSLRKLLTVEFPCGSADFAPIPRVLAERSPKCQHDFGRINEPPSVGRHPPSAIHIVDNVSPGDEALQARKGGSPRDGGPALAVRCRRRRDKGRRWTCRRCSRPRWTQAVLAPTRLADCWQYW